MEVSIVIPSQLMRPELVSCVESCLKQRAHLREVLVCCDRPSQAGFEGHQKLFAGKDQVRLVMSRGSGVNAARNLGAELARAELVYFLDDDCELADENHLSNLVGYFFARPQFALAGGGYGNPPGSPVGRRACNLQVNSWVRFGLSGEDAAQLPGGNLCVRREVFKAGHRFDERLSFGADETEFLRRIRAAGLRIGYCEKLTVLHRPESSWLFSYQRAWRAGFRSGELKLSTPFRLAHFLGALRMMASDPACWPHLAYHLLSMLAGRAASYFLPWTMKREKVLSG